jgi:hypothetical protein
MLKRAWETAVLSCIASEMRDKFDTRITIYTQGGIEGLEKLDAFSWLSLRPIEKSFIILGKAKLWHLWSYADEAPSWWPIVRTRARTMHTKLNNAGKWRGHPSVLAHAMADNGETVIPPGFGSMIEHNVNWLPNADELHLENGNMSDAMLGAYASLNGTCVIAPHTAILDEILGLGGYTKKGTNDALTELNNKDATVSMTSDESNSDALDLQAEIHTSSSGIASSARRNIQEKFQPAESAKKLALLYRKILGEKG